MKTEADVNHRKRRNIREIARRLVVEYAPYIITISRTPLPEIYFGQQGYILQKMNTFSSRLSVNSIINIRI